MLFKLLPEAEKNFIYKMLRKKNITLNDKKASGNEALKSGDCIRIYFSDETYEKFAGAGAGKITPDENCTRLDTQSIIYEDDDILLVNKPAGVLSQRAAADDYSMVEMIGHYLEEKGEYDSAGAAGFKPAVANRLDRNTSGIIAAGKSISGLKFLSDGFKSNTFKKLYLCIAKGELKDELMLNGLWSKSSHGNKVVIKDAGARPDGGFPRELFIKGNVPVQTQVSPVRSNGEATLCIVRLMTGKTHQIRAHLASVGFPLLGDYKYGDKAFNDRYKRLYGIEFQLLHAILLDIPGKGTFFAGLPDSFKRLLKGENLWVHGIQEVLEDRLSRISSI